MMNDFNLDDLKKSWQEHSPEPKYKDSDIHRILNRKSTNYVKFIFWISLAEFLFFLVITLLAWVNRSNESTFLSQMEESGFLINESIRHNFSVLFSGFKILSLLITLYFVWIFFKKYHQIRVENSVRQFIQQILKFRKSVNHFILINIGLIIVFFMIISVYPLLYLRNPDTEHAYSHITFISALLIGGALSIGLIYLYYRLIYGTLLRRLMKNLKQLQKIEEEQNETPAD